MTRIRELTRLKALAIKATGQGPDKWTANTELISWFRSDPVAIVDVLLDVARWDSHPGGIANQNLKRDLALLPKVEKEDAA